MKAIKQYDHNSNISKVVLTVMFVHETLMCDHSNESCLEVLSCDTPKLVVYRGSL